MLTDRHRRFCRNGLNTLSGEVAAYGREFSRRRGCVPVGRAEEVDGGLDVSTELGRLQSDVLAIAVAAAAVS